MDHVLAYCKHCGVGLDAYDVKFGPGDGECANCAHASLDYNNQWEPETDEGVSLRAQLLRGLAQSGRLVRRA